MQVRFVPAATPERIAAAAALADKVWNEHYAGLLAPAQIAYMVDKFQSAGAIARQIAQEGYRYFLLELDGRAAGYTAVQTTGQKAVPQQALHRKGRQGTGRGLSGAGVPRGALPPGEAARHLADGQQGQRLVHRGVQALGL